MIHKIPQKLCGNDPDPLDPSTNAKKGSRIRQDPGSWIFQILDPRPFLVFGTCPIHTCITHCHLFVNLCAKISSRYIKNDQSYDYDMTSQNQPLFTSFIIILQIPTLIFFDRFRCGCMTIDQHSQLFAHLTKSQELVVMSQNWF